ncbi:hypothetical protein [Sporosarcina sp. BP05]|uniref:hypothetical protein n=1 Tax=Sporosarcina sp. BP05 TaxID=2758726 RepID=UPI001645A303|nr:hypothetical protein [Sporosarcina sp. BP05]
MNDQSNEKGYALIIVLFAIVFITVITAVFLRGALSNAIQEKTLDENNLVVVSAESGTEYYSWELKQVYDKDLLEVKFTKLVNDAIAAKESPIDYDRIQRKIASDFKPELTKRADSLIGEGATDLFSDYKHKLVAANVEQTELNGDIWFTVKGTVEGELPKNDQQQRKKKELEFELIFVFPKVQLADGSTSVDPGGVTSPGGSLVMMPALKEPKKPASPVAIVAISKQSTNCASSSTKIDNQKCNTLGISEAIYAISKSNVFIDNTLNSWGNVSLENSILNIGKNFTPAESKIEDTELVVGGKIEAYRAVVINKSKIHANEYNNSGGTGLITNSQMNITTSLVFQTANIENSIISTNIYKANNQADFNKTDLKVLTNYNSGGASFKNSNLEVGGYLDTGGGLFYVEGSNVKIVGNAQTNNGSTIKNSVLNIGGYFLHTSKPLDAENSDIFVGGKLTATNGTNLEQVNMNVLGDYVSSTAFKLAKTNLNIAGNLSLSNGGTVNNSLMVAGRITASTPLVLNGSVVSAGYLQSDIMTLNNSKVCAKDLNVRSLMMDDDSKIYYSNTSNHTKNNIIKLSSVDFEKTCGMNSSTTPEDSKQSGKIEWKSPVLDKVTY